MFEERFYQNSVDSHVVSDLNEDLMEPLNFRLSQAVLWVQESRNFVWVYLVKWVLFQAWCGKNQIDIVHKPDVFDLVWVSGVLVDSLDSFGLVWSQLDPE